jgi:TATA-box binding protein (TBP) (component of TFIID and TFIIIB)
MKKSHEFKEKYNTMSYIGISTITMVCELNTQINIEKLTNNFTSPEYPICFLKKTKKHDEYEITKRGKTIKSFYNQITINYFDHSTKSIKVFSNGRLQITGLSSVGDAKKATQYLITILRLSANSTDSLNISVKSAKIAMINSNFSFNIGIDIIKLKYNLEQKYKNMQIIYNPDVYPGLKIKHATNNGVSSIFVFSTGNVVITGVKSITEIEESFQCISEIVVDDIAKYKTLFTPTKKQNKKIPLYKRGYPIQLYNMCVL